ncbi:amidase [Roseovarius aestuariivivens]|uniref:amidase n=1 Tax=Roseovarius aestuariivivens TaxID=1888910 RepID=UPI0014369A76|nr:amidase [Roseovarius aestuariivivens]
MPTPDPCYLPTREVLARFASGALTPSAYLDALISRTEAVNTKINAYTETFFDAAREAASAADARYVSGTQRPLEGLPVAVKDAQRVAGQRTTQGSFALEDNIEDHSDPMVERLLAAGAIIHARTTTPEFCLSGVCWSNLWGVTRNPFSLAFGPGGSSGGSAAALAAGMTPLATGTDIGGSIRIPASSCGLAGYKPPHGRNPDGPPANFDRYNHCGFLARDVGDIALAQNIVSGPHPRDHDSLRDRVTLPDSFPPRALRVAYSLDFGYMPLDPDVRANTQAALDIFRATGAMVEKVDPGWDAHVDTASMQWYTAMHFGRMPLWLLEEFGARMTPYARAAAHAAQNAKPDDVARSWEYQHEMYQRFGALMEDYDIFICPTQTIGALPAEHDPLAPDFRVDGQVVDGEYGWVMTHPFNMLHNCPVMSVPSGRDRHGIPTGIQIVGRTFDDRGVFEAAMLYREAAPDLFLPASGLPGFAP